MWSGAGSGSHHGEEDDVADGGLAREEHGESIDAESEPAGGWHADFERFDEVSVEVAEGGFLVVEAGELLAEAGGLDVGVVEFGVVGSDFHAADEEVGAVGEVVVFLVRSGERAKFGGVVGDPGRRARVECGFGDVFEEFVDEEENFDAALVGGAAFFFEVLGELGEQAASLGFGADAVVVVHVEAEGGVEEFGVGDAAEGAFVVDGVVMERESFWVGADGVGDGASGVADEVFGDRHDGFDVAEGLVELEHGELGVVLLVEAFVAEVAIDLEDTGHTADEEAFEVELGGDAHEEVDVEGVHVGAERSGGGAAGLGLEHGRFDLDEAAFVETFAERAHDEAAQLEGLHGVGGVVEVDVAFAVALLDVSEAGPFFGRRREAFGAHAHGGGPDGDLAFVGFHERPFDDEDVAEVGEFGDVEAGLGDVAARDGDLQVGREAFGETGGLDGGLALGFVGGLAFDLHGRGGGAVAELEPDELAALALEDDAAGESDAGAGVVDGGELVVAGALFGGVFAGFGGLFVGEVGGFVIHRAGFGEGDEPVFTDAVGPHAEFDGGVAVDAALGLEGMEVVVVLAVGAGSLVFVCVHGAHGSRGRRVRRPDATKRRIGSAACTTRRRYGGATSRSRAERREAVRIGRRRGVLRGSVGRA